MYWVVFHSAPNFAYNASPKDGRAILSRHAHNTIYKQFAEPLGALEADESPMGGRGKRKERIGREEKILAFNIIKRNRKVRYTIVRNKTIPNLGQETQNILNREVYIRRRPPELTYSLFCVTGECVVIKKENAINSIKML